MKSTQAFYIFIIFIIFLREAPSASKHFQEKVNFRRLHVFDESYFLGRFRCLFFYFFNFFSLFDDVWNGFLDLFFLIFNFFSSWKDKKTSFLFFEFNVSRDDQRKVNFFYYVSFNLEDKPFEALINIHKTISLLRASVPSWEEENLVSEIVEITSTRTFFYFLDLVGDLSFETKTKKIIGSELKNINKKEIKVSNAKSKVKI